MRVAAKKNGALRIVSLAPSVTSILCAVGARRNLVGVTKWCGDVAPVGGLPKLGDCWRLESVEEIAALRPDVVIGSVPFKTETVAAILAKPWAFVALNPRSLADVYKDVRLLAGMVERRANGEKLIRTMEREFTKGGSNPRRGGESARPRIYCEAWPKPRISSPPWVAELAEMAGGKFVTRPGSAVSDEEVAAANPEIVVLAWAAVGGKSKPQQAYSVAAWRDVAAIRTRNVFVVRDEWLNTPGPPLLRGVKELRRIVALWKAQKRAEGRRGQ